MRMYVRVLSYCWEEEECDGGMEKEYTSFFVFFVLCIFTYPPPFLFFNLSLRCLDHVS